MTHEHDSLAQFSCTVHKHDSRGVCAWKAWVAPMLPLLPTGTHEEFTLLLLCSEIILRHVSSSVVMCLACTSCGIYFFHLICPWYRRWRSSCLGCRRTCRATSSVSRSYRWVLQVAGGNTNGFHSTVRKWKRETPLQQQKQELQVGLGRGVGG